MARSRCVRALTALGNRVDAHVILGEHGPLVDRLREVGATVEVLPMPVAAREVRKDSVRPGTLGLRAVAASLQYVWTLRRRLRELQPDVIHTNSLKAAFYGGVAGRLAGIPVIWHVRDRIAPDYLPTAAFGWCGWGRASFRRPSSRIRRPRWGRCQSLVGASSSPIPSSTTRFAEPHLWP